VSNRPWLWALAFAPLAVLLVVGTAARARSWADVLTVAAFVGGRALLGALAYWTGRTPPGEGQGSPRRGGAPAANRVRPAPRVSPQRFGARGWPSYRRCMENAPPAKEGGRPDLSRADFPFSLLALDWGWTLEETAARLLQESPKAQENGAAYALRTARNVAAAVARRAGPQR
jgi:hypothetical protein